MGPSGPRGPQVYAYDAYGNTHSFDLADALTSHLYSGERTDQLTGFQYLRARYYNPATGTFNRLDPFAGNFSDPQSLHKYLYCHADAVNGIDPSGESLMANVNIAITSGMRISSMAARAAGQVYKKFHYEINGMAFLGFAYHEMSKNPTSNPIFATEGVLAGFQLGTAVHLAKLPHKEEDVLAAGLVNAIFELCLSWVEEDYFIQVADQTWVGNSRVLANVVTAFCEGAFEQAVQGNLTKLPTGAPFGSVFDDAIMMLSVIGMRDIARYLSANPDLTDVSEFKWEMFEAGVDALLAATVMDGSWVDRYPALRKRGMRVAKVLLENPRSIAAKAIEGIQWTWDQFHPDE